MHKDVQQRSTKSIKKLVLMISCLLNPVQVVYKQNIVEVLSQRPVPALLTWLLC